ncbi:MAG: hypothetical protein Q9194_004785 [Teloschistes cf. exilis]
MRVVDKEDGLYEVQVRPNIYYVVTAPNTTLNEEGDSIPQPEELPCHDQPSPTSEAVPKAYGYSEKSDPAYTYGHRMVKDTYQYLRANSYPEEINPYQRISSLSSLKSQTSNSQIDQCNQLSISRCLNTTCSLSYPRPDPDPLITPPTHPLHTVMASNQAESILTKYVLYRTRWTTNVYGNPDRPSESLDKERRMMIRRPLKKIDFRKRLEIEDFQLIFWGPIPTEGI